MRTVDGELRQLANGPLHRFSGFATLGGVIPRTGAGVYTIWDDAGELVYVGIADGTRPVQVSRRVYGVTRPAGAAAISSVSTSLTTT